MNKQRYLYYFILASLLSSHEVLAQEASTVNNGVNTSSTNDNSSIQQNITSDKTDDGQSHLKNNESGDKNLANHVSSGQVIAQDNKANNEPVVSDVLPVQPASTTSATADKNSSGNKDSTETSSSTSITANSASSVDATAKSNNINTSNIPASSVATDVSNKAQPAIEASSTNVNIGVNSGSDKNSVKTIQVDDKNHEEAALPVPASSASTPSTSSVKTNGATQTKNSATPTDKSSSKASSDKSNTPNNNSSGNKDSTGTSSSTSTTASSASSSPDIYDVTLNNNWNFSSVVFLEDGDVLIPIKYLPPDVLGNITDLGFMKKGDSTFLKVNNKNITKKDIDNLVLEINLPEEYFKTQQIKVNQDTKQKTKYIDATYLNYDINFSSAGFADTKGTFTWNYASKNNWVVDNNFLWDGKQLVRLNSYWQKQNANDSSWVFGDTQGTTISGFNSVNFAGIRYVSSYYNNAQFLQNSMPIIPINGFAVNPSRLDLYINNQLVQQSTVASGKYSLNIPYQNVGLGTAQAVVYDITGKPVAITVPFYSNTELIKAGDNEYDIGAGMIRQNYGLNSFDYAVPIANVMYKRGITSKYTQDLFVMASGVYSAASALSHWVPIPQVGMFNLGASYNSYHQAMYTAGYERISGNFSVGGTYQWSKDFCFGFGQYCMQKQVQAYTGFSLPYKFGNLNFNYVKRQTSTAVTNVMAAQWNKQLTKNISIYANLTDVSGTSSSKSVYVGLSINLGKRLYSNTSYTAQDGKPGYQQSIYMSEDEQHPATGFGSITFDKDQDNESANLYYGARLRNLQYQMNLYKDKQGQSGNLDVTGGIAYVPSANYFSFVKPVQSGLAYVNIENVTKPVEVLHENKFAGYTNDKGQLIVPDVIAMNNERIALDINHMDKGVTLDYYQKDFYVPFSGAVEVDFKAKPLPYVVTIKGAKPGSIFNIGENYYVVGDNGLTAVENSGKATIPLDIGKTCEIEISPKQKEYECK